MRNGTSTASGVRGRRPIRVIVADDQEPVRHGLEVLLEALGDIEVVAKAADGAEAVRLAADLGPDLVLMDCRMPILDGLDATRQLKHRSPEISVLMLSMYPDLRTEALAAGADGFLLKGGSGAELVDKIDRTIRKKRRRRKRSPRGRAPRARSTKEG